MAEEGGGTLAGLASASAAFEGAVVEFRGALAAARQHQLHTEKARVELDAERAAFRAEVEQFQRER